MLIILGEIWTRRASTKPNEEELTRSAKIYGQEKGK
jgi:hypothetical protein